MTVFTLLAPLVVYSMVAYVGVTFRWKHYSTLFLYYFITRPFLPGFLNVPINVIASTIIVYAISASISNRYFHPLSRFPGPRLRSTTRLQWSLDKWNGRSIQSISRLHRKYGPIVRVAPDELSFNDVQALREIYEMRGSRYPLSKQESVLNSKSPDGSHALLNARDEVHERMRTHMQPAFSGEAVSEQEVIVRQHADRFLQSIENQVSSGDGSKAVVVDISRWFSYAALDIISDLSFGRSFRSLSEKSERKWIPLLHAQDIFVSKKKALENYSPRLKPFVALILPPTSVPQSKDFWTSCTGRIHDSLKSAVSRPDILSKLTRPQAHGAAAGMSTGEIEATAYSLNALGVETVAGSLSAAICFLLQKPSKLRKLEREVRTAFASASAIGFESTIALPYLAAVLSESTRLAPPVAGSNTRVMDEGSSTICSKSIPKGTIVSVSQYALHRSPAYFSYASTFIPERWLSSTPSLIQPAAEDPFFTETTFKGDRLDAVRPFSVGPRSCIGQTLAQGEMRLLLALLVYTYDIRGAGAKGSEVVWEEQKFWEHWERQPLLVTLKRVER